MSIVKDTLKVFVNVVAVIIIVKQLCTKILCSQKKKRFLSLQRMFFKSFLPSKKVLKSRKIVCCEVAWPNLSTHTFFAVVPSGPLGTGTIYPCTALIGPSKNTSHKLELSNHVFLAKLLKALQYDKGGKNIWVNIVTKSTHGLRNIFFIPVS